MIRQRTWPPWGRGLISLYIYMYIENFKTLLVKSHWTDFNLLAEMVPWWPSTKIVQAMVIRQKNKAVSRWGLFTLYIYIENFRNLLIRNHWTDFNITWQGCSFGGPLPSLFKLSKPWPLEGGAYSPYVSIENTLISFCQKPLDQFQYIGRNCSLVTIFQDSVQAIMLL